MTGLAAKIASLYGEDEMVHDETGHLGSLAELLSPVGPLLVLLGNAEGQLVAAQCVEGEVPRERACRLALRLRDCLTEAEACLVEDDTPWGLRLAFALPLGERADNAFLGGWVRPAQHHRRTLEELRNCLALCGRLAWHALKGDRGAIALRKRVEHLLAERDTLKASHAEAMIAVIEEHEKRLEAQQEQMVMEQSVKAAEATNRAKSQFLANMSHELRTPLHGILSFASFGIKKWETAPRENLVKYFEKIENSGTILLAMVDDLLDLAKLESGRMKFEFRRLELGRLIHAAVDEFNSMTESRNITIQSPPGDKSGAIVGDPSKLLQVLRNLLSNAIKFSPDGATIEIDVDWADPLVRVSVLDRGVGIPEDELEAVFDKFIQSSKTRTGAGGTGLGLSICREIVAGHKGRIWAENRTNGGAVLKFEIPISVNDDQPPLTGPPETET